MDLQLNGKLALVSASTAGIGLAIATTLAREGARVIVNAARFGWSRQNAVDLVNNLGIFEPKPFEEISDNDWVRFFEVNVLSGVRLARLFLPAMKRAKWGRMIASLVAYIASPLASATTGAALRADGGVIKSAF